MPYLGNIPSPIILQDVLGNYNFDYGTLYIDSVNNRVGIGTTSPKSSLHISGSSVLQQSYQTYLVNAYYDGAWKYIENGMAWGIGNNFGGPTNGICIATATVNSSGNDAALTWLPRLNIDSSGTVHIGKTTGSVTTNGLTFYPGGPLHHVFTITSNEAFIFNNLTSATTYTLSFRTSNNQRGSISVSDSAVAYNTSSDYRLKENIVPLNDAIKKLNLLKPRRFNFKSEPDKVIEGFIAHEVAEIVPNAITGEKDAVDDEGNIKPQGMDASKLIPLLTSALQEAVSRINVLEQRIEQLETN